MDTMLAENWWLVVAALLIGLLVAWWIFSSTRRTTITRDEAPDVGEPGKAKRNHALIDSPRETTLDSGAAAEAIAPSVAGMGGVAMAATQLATKSEPETEPERVAAEPAPEAPPASASEPVAAGADDLTQIKGLGPRISARLQEAGVTSFTQIAGWSEADIDDFDERMNFKGRVRRDRWVDQARMLASGDHAAYEAEFGKL
ncbi:hypothetical protein QQS45_09400 [Alteriqipengyuania flavescens]|uniref:hypothetical protein n=1 Tax=Alteriqipengyuania flavescens TaxID=3053610 RepID=UPI0025B307C9|nr:hypothetical protein [Alteriqipengyuania flavescens]WJY17845.1 hypothetical protein QQW98_09395 [Alteriqipengyuania flavescens]WJY23786.1 hypothetical protein QQS45_09400 [Alteriqipengyuania flavescens]